MTAAQPLTCTWSYPDQHTARVELAGDLDYDTGDGLLVETIRSLAEHPNLRELRLNCAKLGFCDSHGLSVLIMVHRTAHTAGARLRLEDIPPGLGKVLELTGILGHLTGAPADADPQQDSGGLTPLS